VRLWAGASTHFVRETTHNQIAEKLRGAFFAHYRYNPPQSEVNAWRNSLRAVASVFQEAGLDDHGVMLEYQLPQTSRRLDVLVCGHDAAGDDRAVIIELKQWERCQAALGDKLVTTFVGGAERDMLHPSAQVERYQLYLQDTHTAFYEGERPIGLDACAYLHNYFPCDEDVLFAEPFKPLVERCPVFTADDVGRLSRHLGDRLDGGEGLDVLKRIEESKYRPSKKLMDHVAATIREKPQWVLLDEQLVVFEKVLACAREGFHDRRKTVLIVKGGPGTGKSVIAINLMAALLREQYNAQYATGSRAFTETLRAVVGIRGVPQFGYFNGYTDAEPNAVDVLICDESHRIRESSDNRYTPKAKRSPRPQIDELLSSSKMTVFLLDDHQVVRPGEIGSVGYIRQTAVDAGHRVLEYELEAQFRCAGSEGFVAWVENTLGIRRTANVLWDPTDAFDFRIMSTPSEVEQAIRAKASEGVSARMTAGFCWKWSKPLDGGSLARDVVVGDYARPWNARPEARQLARGIPKASLWATEPGGIDQVGCVYTAQGFEFDYAGVIFGDDLVYDFERHEWAGHADRSHDTVVKRSKGRFTDLVKNTYRVLLTRGLKGCYVCFVDRDTERFVRSRVEG
jgi:DUF2075 family protein